MATTMSEPRELFLHELGDILYAENVLVKALPKMAQEADDADLSTGFEEHLDETKKHVAVLEQVFETLGEKPKAEKCPGIEGIKKEHDEFIDENTTSAEMLDAFLTGAASRTEHYEIAAYTGLVTQARALKQPDAVALLQENLKQEKEALKKVETISKRLLKDANGSPGNGKSRSRAA